MIPRLTTEVNKTSVLGKNKTSCEWHVYAVFMILRAIKTVGIER